MFRLSVISDEISQDFAHALDVAKEYGLEYVELRAMWGKNLVDLDEGEAAKAKAILQEKGMKVCGISSPFFKCLLEEKEGEVTGPAHQAKERSFQEQIPLLEHLIKLARVFEVNLIRTFSFWRKGEYTEQIKERIIQAYKKPLEIAARENIILGLENEHSCYIGTGKEAGEIVGAVNDDHFKIVWDPGNAFLAKENPYPEGYKQVKEHFVHVHIKDARWLNKEEGKFEFCVVGQGEIDYQGHFQALKNEGYNGFASLETHYRTPDGDSEKSSRLCLENMQKIVASLA